MDIDVTVFLEESRWVDALAVLEAQGATIDRAAVLRELDAMGSCRVSGFPFPVDVFVPSIPFYESVQERVVTRPLLGRPAPRTDSPTCISSIADAAKRE